MCLTPADMRKSFDGLSELVRTGLGGDPLSGHLFVFRNRRGDRLKLLYWDCDGLAVWAKRAQYQFPRPFKPWLYGIALNKCRENFRGHEPPAIELKEGLVPLSAGPAHPFHREVFPPRNLHRAERPR